MFLAYFVLFAGSGRLVADWFGRLGIVSGPREVSCQWFRAWLPAGPWWFYLVWQRLSCYRVDRVDSFVDGWPRRSSSGYWWFPAPRGPFRRGRERFYCLDPSGYLSFASERCGLLKHRGYGVVVFLVGYTSRGPGRVGPRYSRFVIGRDSRIMFFTVVLVVFLNRFVVVGPVVVLAVFSR